MLIQVTSENPKHVYITETLGGECVKTYGLWTYERKVYFGAALSLGYPMAGTILLTSASLALTPLSNANGRKGQERWSFLHISGHSQWLPWNPKGKDTSLSPHRHIAMLTSLFSVGAFTNFLGHSEPWAASNNFARLSSQLCVLFTGWPKLCGGLSTETRKSFLEESHLLPQAMFS